MPFNHQVPNQSRPKWMRSEALPQPVLTHRKGAPGPSCRHTQQKMRALSFVLWKPNWPKGSQCNHLDPSPPPGPSKIGKGHLIPQVWAIEGSTGIPEVTSQHMNGAYCFILQMEKLRLRGRALLCAAQWKRSLGKELGPLLPPFPVWRRPGLQRISHSAPHSVSGNGTPGGVEREKKGHAHQNQPELCWEERLQGGFLPRPNLRVNRINTASTGSLLELLGPGPWPE